MEAINKLEQEIEAWIQKEAVLLVFREIGLVLVLYLQEIKQKSKFEHTILIYFPI